MTTEEKTIQENTQKEIIFAKFWPRAGAYLLDLVLIGTVILLINTVNIIYFRSFMTYLSGALIAILYKPVLEWYFSATLGKMAFNLKVTNQYFGKISFQRSFLRSFILILPAILYVPIYYLAFKDPSFANINEVSEFTAKLLKEYPIQNWLGYIAMFIAIIDLLVLLSDISKKKRSLHDRIAKTIVVKEE